MDITCPHCHCPMVYTWNGCNGAGACSLCGFYEYYESYEEFLGTMNEGDAGV